MVDSVFYATFFGVMIFNFLILILYAIGFRQLKSSVRQALNRRSSKSDPR